MPRKGENIYKRKDGRWEARYIKGHELSGRARYGFCYGKSYQEAKEKALRCKAAIQGHAPLPVTSRHGFSFFCEEWLELKRRTVKESTLVKYDTILRKHILPRLDDYPPQGINTQLAEQFRQQLQAQGLSAKTVRDILMVLQAVLKHAAVKHPGEFPVVEINYPKGQKKEARVLNREEQERLAAHLRADLDECRLGILLALMTGLRVGELCALRWENISLRDRTLRVDATMQRIRNLDGDGPGKTKVIIHSPKSGTSIRTIPLTDSALALCTRFHCRKASAFLLTGTDKYMEPRSVQKRLAKYTRECGLEGVHFHTLRHTFATRCVEVGFEIKSLAEVLGHANTAITLNRYIHSSMELKRANMSKLSSVGM